ncbi:flavin monoamine oxidase family protein [Kaistella jeonii]|uniref:Amine oxidase n=1 Tax=Kaistella jeonii TaxID=266749 RepID=A0A0C1D1J2_9FLAO|nr:NAD(P)/FAD-dependent oxidoreductase [Kaistella jeonii]KIA90706.1 amine oxidase [Kaistella jeonii]SFB68841.1 monoamine oxidase [Kaistella jeonii]VEI94680.1 Putrescine oxidase [Kaistella jeonii]
MIVIVGAGLSGLLTAYLLKKEGIPFKILEARNRVGGRINTIYRKEEAPIEMGATWFTAQHPNLIALLEELGIGRFEQYMDSKVFYEPNSNFPAQIVEIPKNEPNYRIAGGTSNLINTLVRKLNPEDVILNQAVKEIEFNTNSVFVKAENIFEGKAVVLALPPKLWANGIIFEPEIAEHLKEIALQTHTWMEDSIKVALTFAKPFWKEENLPRTLFSNVGPIVEFYDQCDEENSRYALCGFINSAFKQLSYSERKELVIDQLKNIFGSRVEEFLHYEECVWSEEIDTFEDSEHSLFPHQNNGNPIFRDLYFDNRLIISGSETSSKFPGYMEGAVISAIESVQKIVESRR